MPNIVYILIYIIIFQITFSLAVAEQKFQFEHRDLHWGNVLVAPTNEKNIIYKFNNKVHTIPTNGVKATIIDYTLSRLKTNNETFFNDLSKDDELFSASGDYQFEVYRLMKKKLSNDWQQYNPFTNVLWLHYITEKLLNGVQYKLKKSNVQQRKNINVLKDVYKKLLDFKTSHDICATLFLVA